MSGGGTEDAEWIRPPIGTYRHLFVIPHTKWKQDMLKPVTPMKFYSGFLTSDFQSLENAAYFSLTCIQFSASASLSPPSIFKILNGKYEGKFLRE